MSNYKNFLLRQLGIKESTSSPIPSDNSFPGIDPDDHKEDISPREKMMSPTAVKVPVIGVAVRGSCTGGLPSGKEITPSNLGGYEPVSDKKENSVITDKTPANSDINSKGPVLQHEPKTDETPHPHQIQKDAGDPPQSVTGASDDGSTDLKASVPKNALEPENEEPSDKEGEVDIDISEKNKGEEEESEGKFPTEKLQEIRKSLQEKAALGKMNKKETELFSTITEVLQKRGHGIEQRMFSKKSLLETAKVTSGDVDKKIKDMKDKKDSEKASSDNKKNMNNLERDIRRSDLA